MIIYERGGLNRVTNLFRVHGSATYKVILPALFSTGITLIYDYAKFNGLIRTNIPFVGQYYTPEDLDEDATIVQHPYTIGAFIAIFSLLLTFRLNFAYGRYWEGATAVYHMTSKWLDCAILMCSCHYQSVQFDDIRPPCFGSYDKPITEDHIDSYDRETPRYMAEQQDLYASKIPPLSSENNSSESEKKKFQPFYKLRQRRRSRSLPSPKQVPTARAKSINISSTSKDNLLREAMLSKIPIPMRFQDQLLNPKNDVLYQHETENLRNAKLLEMSRTGQATRKITRTSRIPAPSLYLQETAHLISLLNAVALSTLRCDIDIAATPITPYVPGVPWPDVDPDNLPRATKEQYGDGNPITRWLYFCLGLSRSAKRRTLYNAARPFGVLGGVSDGEIFALQRARGPYAKVALVTMWLQEFISREYLAGSDGQVAAPFLSRIHQFLSDGVAGYNQARKVAYVPFPFVSAQISTFFSVVIIFVFPLLFSSFVTNTWFAIVLNFLTVLCFLGMNEVSRELDNPYQNIPNDIPLTTYQAEMNEALVTMYAGFHPDSWWQVIDVDAINF